MIHPSIHLNGTSGKELLEGYRKAGDAVQDAIKSHNESAPHSRDYYVQSSEAFIFAQHEHVARGRKLQEVLAELQELQAHVFNNTPFHKL